MGYKLIYVEDLNPGSIVADLTNNGFEVAHCNPGGFEKLISEISGQNFDALLLDYRLTQGAEKAIFDAPTIAQMHRTNSAINHKHFPIFLISSEKIISTFYEDFASNDLFDFSISKEEFQQNLEKYCARLNDIIEAYRFIPEVQFDLTTIVGLKGNVGELLDYRLLEKLNDPNFSKNTYKISRLLYNTFIRGIGALIGEDVLSARLGVKKTSKGWDALKNTFSDAKYNGVFSKSHDRWWSVFVENIAVEKFGIASLRRLKASERAELWKNAGFQELEVLEKLEFAESENFWTICKDLKSAIDPIDGLELVSRDIIPWQETEYISLLAAMRSSDFLKRTKDYEMARFTDFVKGLSK